MRSRCDGSMLAGHLEHERRERGRRGRAVALHVLAGWGWGTRSTTASSSLPHAEVGERRTEERRRRLGPDEEPSSRSAPTSPSRPISSWAVCPGLALVGRAALRRDRRSPRGPPAARATVA